MVVVDSGWSIGINGAINISWNNGENHGGIGISASSGQTWGWALDMDAGKLHVYVNGVIRFSGNSIVPSGTSLKGRSFTSTQINRIKVLRLISANGPINITNAGTNRPSADYKPLATCFLPEPTIKRGDEAMDAVVYSGNNSNNKIKLDFAPDILWLKSTTSSQYGAIASVVEGANYFNPPNQTGAQKGPGFNDDIKSFDDDGFSLGSDTYYNAVNRVPNTYSALAWDAGDTTTRLLLVG